MAEAAYNNLNVFHALLTFTSLQVSFHFCKDQTFLLVFRLRLTLLRQGTDEGRHWGVLFARMPQT